MRNKNYDKIYIIWCVAISGTSIFLMLGNNPFSLTRLLVGIALLTIAIVVEVVRRDRKGAPPSGKVGN